MVNYNYNNIHSQLKYLLQKIEKMNKINRHHKPHSNNKYIKIQGFRKVRINPPKVFIFK